jgi:dTDP-4-dehydrorhamnose reductase
LQTSWDIIIHTGALTHVDRCEQEPELSKYLTVNSAINLINFSAKIGAKFVYISTDYVFDGTSGPYSENSQTNPLSIYGQHKLEVEKIIASTLTNYLILRITNVYGSELRNKNLLSRTIQDFKNKNQISIKAPYDQYSTPINAFDIARSLMLLLNDKKNGIYHLSSTDFLSRVQFMQKINSYLNNRLTVIPVDTNSLNQIAKRPLLGGLLAEKFLSEYPGFEFTSLDSYLINTSLTVFP